MQGAHVDVGGRRVEELLQGASSAWRCRAQKGVGSVEMKKLGVNCGRRNSYICPQRLDVDGVGKASWLRS